MKTELKGIDAMEFKVGNHVRSKSGIEGIILSIGRDAIIVKSGEYSETIVLIADATLCLPEKWAIKTDRQEFFDWVNINKTDTDNVCRNPESGPYINSNNGYTSWFGSDSIPNGYTEITFEYWCRVHRPDLLESKWDKINKDFDAALEKAFPPNSIPDKWCVRRTPENAEVLNAWGNSLSRENKYTDGCMDWQGNGWSGMLRDYPEITYEQWQTIPEVVEWLKSSKFSEEETKRLDNLYGMYDVVSPHGLLLINQQRHFVVTNSEEKTLFSVSVHPKPEDREIEGYKAPFDMYQGEVKKGDVYQRSISDPNLYFSVNYDEYLPAEWVETWEPVYKEAPKPVPVWERFPTWESIKSISGFYTREVLTSDANQDLFSSRKHAESALAFAQLSQIEKVWNDVTPETGERYSVWLVDTGVTEDLAVYRYGLHCMKPLISFKTELLARKSLELHGDLWRKFRMV